MNILEMSDAEFEAFARPASTTANEIEAAEILLTEILSDAMRADTPQAKATFYVELANKAMALADTTLGYQGCVAASLHLNKH